MSKQPLYDLSDTFGPYKPKKHKNSELVEITKKAHELGLSYGQYVAKYMNNERSSYVFATCTGSVRNAHSH